MGQLLQSNSEVSCSPSHLCFPAERSSVVTQICVTACLCMWIGFGIFPQQFLKHHLKINVAKVVSSVCIGIHYGADTVVCMVRFIH